MAEGYKEGAIRTKADATGLMRGNRLRIGIVAPASRVDPGLAEKVTALAASLYPDRIELFFHPQCYLSSGHFAGDDATRAKAFLDVANDPAFDVLWVARGGYGSCRLLELILPQLADAALRKTYMGYS